MDEDSRKAERRKGQSISIRLSEILTNELHKYLYLYFMFYSSFNYQSSITIWIRLTEIYKMTIACFKLTISVGLTLTHVRFITWMTQCTCWLVVRSCDKELRLWTCVLSFQCRYQGMNRHDFCAPSFWRRCRGLFEFGQLTVHLVAQIR